MTDDVEQRPGGDPDEQARIRQEKLRTLRQKLRTEPPVVGQNADGSATGPSEKSEDTSGLPRFAQMLRERRAGKDIVPGITGQGSGGGDLLKRLAGLRQNAPGGGHAGAAGAGGGDRLKRLAAFRQKGGGEAGAAGGDGRGMLLKALLERRAQPAADGQAPFTGAQAAERFPRLRERLLARGGGPTDGEPAPRNAQLDQDVRRLEEKVRELEAELREARTEVVPGGKDGSD